MSIELKRSNLNQICKIVLAYMREGLTMENFLFDFDLSQRQFNRYLKKNKKLQNTIEDGLAFFKSSWQRKLANAMMDSRVNQTLAKMAFENALGWSEAAQRRQSEAKPKRAYKVILDMGPEEGENENEK